MVTQPDIPAGEAPGDPPGPAAAPPSSSASPAGPPATEPLARSDPWAKPLPPPDAYPHRSAGSFALPSAPPPAAAPPPTAATPYASPRWDPAGRRPEYGPDEAAEPPPARPGLSRSARLWLTMLALLLGVAGLAASVIGFTAQVLPRQFTTSQQRQIMAWETASRWRTWPAGKIFPATVSYQLSGTDFDSTTSLTLQARRVGIAPQSSCSATTDKPLARVLTKDGCQGVLRATYTDATDSYVVTVGVAVMHGNAPAPSQLPQSQGLRPGVKAVAYRHSLAAGFTDRDRQLSGAYRRGPYLVLYTVGYTDSRRYDHVSMDSYAAGEMTGVGAGLAGRIGSALGAPPPVPHCPGAPGC